MDTHHTHDLKNHLDEQPEHHEVVLADAADDGVPKIAFKTWIALLAHTQCNYLGHYLGNTTLLTTFGPIIREVNEEISPIAGYSWMASANSVASGVVAILAGSLSDFLGRRWFIIGGNVFGVVAAIVGTTAHTAIQLIAAQVLLGIAGGVSFVTFACIAELVSRRQRGTIIAILNLFATIWNAECSLIGRYPCVRCDNI